MEKKYYEISYSDISFDHKPAGKEVGMIKKSIYKKEMTVDYMAKFIGEKGHSFSPAVFSNGTKKENFQYQQLIGLDFDHGATFAEIKAKADKYRIPILFAYKTFSWSENEERFRVIFALSRTIEDSFTVEAIIAMLMKIFTGADQCCKDCTRLFFGGNGCLYVADEPAELTLDDLMIAFNLYMEDEYGQKHYTQRIKEFYRSVGVEEKDKYPVEENGVFRRAVIDPVKKGKTGKSDNTPKADKTPEPRRTVTRNFDYDNLYKVCRLYRDFVDGREYYYYNELRIIATNLINVEKGKKKFIEILKSPVNENCEAYFKRNWRAILNGFIDRDYKPTSCSECKYADKCRHQKNMILTAKPTDSCICVAEPKEYCSCEEAEDSLRENFRKADESADEGFHIVIAQTGLGKTNLYLNHLRTTGKKYIIAVPTHELVKEIMAKAQRIGIENIVSTPQLPLFEDDNIGKQIEHIYNVGAGEITIRKMWDIWDGMKESHPDYVKLRDYLSEAKNCFSYKGHIITTHERLLYLNPNAEILRDHEVIIDEDILRTMFPTCMVTNVDLQAALRCDMFNEAAKYKIRTVLFEQGFYKPVMAEKVDVTEELLDDLDGISSNVIGLIRSCEIYNNGEFTSYIRKKRIPFRKAIVMSATADPELYKMFQRLPVHEYRCMQAKYRGKLKVYPKYTVSRYNLGDEEVMQYIRANMNEGEVITFKAFEDQFDSQFHYGAVEGLNCLEGKDINVIGLPNLDDSIYKLYGMLAGLSAEEVSCAEMRPMRIEYNGFNFKLHTFQNYRLRSIQLWNLSSLLEQAVGRARLLRFDCEVRVFARFAIDQAEFM